MSADLPLPGRLSLLNRPHAQCCAVSIRAGDVWRVGWRACIALPTPQLSLGGCCDNDHHGTNQYRHERRRNRRLF